MTRNSIDGDRQDTVLPVSGSFAIGQRERLTVRLKGLIRQYPRGPGIIKEFLQNADDAGAEHLRIVMDWGHYGGSNVEPGLQPLLGPALLIANDAEFTNKDFHDIRHIGESGKQSVTWKIGRFGLGFNTAYNVTDYPSVLSREWMFCFDPHGDAVAEQDQDGGRGFPLADLRALHPEWLQSFAVAGLDSQANSHSGTIFRLPLRSVERAQVSDISSEPFDEPTFRKIVAAFIGEGAGMLLFTRHILHMTIEEISADSGAIRRLMSIRTENAKKVAASRLRVYDPAKKELDELAAEWAKGPAPRSVHRHSMTIESEAGHHSSTWQVAIGFYPDAEGALLEHARRLAQIDEKAIPEAGVAVALREDGENKWEACPVEGRLYCGLPLPTASGLPVHVNGFFDLDASRIALTSDDSAIGRAEERVEWNRLLLKHCVSQAYVDALQSIPFEIAGRNPGAFYGLWPKVDGLGSPMLRDASIAVHRDLAARSLFRCRTNTGVSRSPLVDIFSLPPSAEGVLTKALVAEGMAIAEPPFPAVVVTGAAAAGIPLPMVTPALLRKRWLQSEAKRWDLKDAPFPALRRHDWLEAILRFILSGSETDLVGLPLALLANGRLATFGFEIILIATEVQKKIFRSRLHWFIDGEYLTATELRPQPAAKLFVMTPQSVMANLHSVLPKIEVGGSREWKVDGDEIPNATWLTLLLGYLAEYGSATPADDLQQFPLIPDQHGRLRSPAHVTTPLLRSKKAVRLIAALEELRVPLVSGPQKLVRAIERFALASEVGVVFEADGPNLIDTLEANVGEWSKLPARNQPSIYGPILDCFAQSSCLESIDDDWLQALQDLPVLPTSDGDMVSAREPNLFIPYGEQPPRSASTFKLVDTGSHGQWRPLFERLQIENLDLPTLIQQILIPSYGDRAPSDRLEILRYIRDNFSRALEQESAGSETPSLKHAVANADLIAAADQKVRPASQLFAPDTPDAEALLGDLAAFPDMETYATGRDAWMTFFLSTGIKQQVGARDVVARILALTSSPPTGETRRAVRSLLTFIQKNWETLSGQIVGAANSAETFAAALKRQAWLPAIQDEDAFPGLRAFENRWYRPDELYSRSLAHCVCSQAPLFDGTDLLGPMQSALGMATRPSLKLVMSHFDRLREMWDDPNEAIDVGSLGTSLRQIYTQFGQLSRGQQGAPSASVMLRTRYAEVPCIWDEPRRRFIRPRDCFRERTPFFEPHKISVGGDSQVQAGLDALGRRDKPELGDFIDFLQTLLAFKVGKPCDSNEIGQVLRALGMVSVAFDEDDYKNLPVLTTRGLLLPLCDVFDDDAPHLKGRIDAADIEIIDPQVPIRIRFAAPRLADAVVETLEELPIRSSNKEINANCQRFASLLSAPEFIHGLRRLVAQKHSYRVTEFVYDLSRFDLNPAISITTSLYLKTSDGALRRVGGGKVAFFADDANSEIWIATASSRRIAAASSRRVIVELARAIDGLLGDFTGVDLAALEDMLRVVRMDEIQEVLEIRHVPELSDDDPFASTWRDSDAEDVNEPDADISQAIHDDEDSSDDGDGDQSAHDQHPLTSKHDTDRVDSAGSGRDPPDTDRPATGASARSERAGTSTPPPNSRGTSSASGPRGAGTRQTKPAREDEPPITPGDGSAGAEGNHAGGGGDGRRPRGDVKSGATGTSNRGRFATYVSSAPEGGSASGDPADSEHELEIGRLAVKRVLAFEHSAGRVPETMPHANPGYDVHSTAPGGVTRYIEVKGIDGPWGEAGVGISKRQFVFATAKAGEAWLYVVEHVRDDAKVKVFPIEDPAGKVTHFFFDVGWRAVTDTGVQTSGVTSGVPRRGDKIILSSGEVVEVDDVEEHGRIIRLRTKSANGEPGIVTWRPGMTIESRGSE